MESLLQGPTNCRVSKYSRCVSLMFYIAAIQVCHGSMKYVTAHMDDCDCLPTKLYLKMGD